MTVNVNNENEAQDDETLDVVFDDVFNEAETQGHESDEDLEHDHPNDSPDDSDEDLDTDEELFDDDESDGVQEDTTQEESTDSDSQAIDVKALQTENALQKETIGKLEHDQVSQRNRVGALTKKIEEIRKNSVSLDAIKGKELEELKEDYPELVPALSAIVKGITGHTADQQIKSVEELLTQEQDKLKSINDDLVTANKNRISEVYSNWENDWETSEFADWFKEQPAALQQAVNSSSADDYLLIMDKYYRDNPNKLNADEKHSKNKSTLLEGHARANKQASTAKQKRNNSLSKGEMFDDIFGD